MTPARAQPGNDDGPGVVCGGSPVEMCNTWATAATTAPRTNSATPKLVALESSIDVAEDDHGARAPISTAPMIVVSRRPLTRPEAGDEHAGDDEDDADAGRPEVVGQRADAGDERDVPGERRTAWPCPTRCRLSSSRDSAR